MIFLCEKVFFLLLFLGFCFGKSMLDLDFFVQNSQMNFKPPTPITGLTPWKINMEPTAITHEKKGK